MADLPALDESALGGWLLEQRWFASKAREVAAFHVLESVALQDAPEPLLGLALVEVRFHPGTHELYQLPIGFRHVDEGWDEAVIARCGDRVAYDALADPVCVERLGGLLAAGADVPDPDDDATWSFRATERLGDAAALAPVRLAGVEQSNTSVVFADRIILKVYRRIEPGPNPELEVLRFLTARGFAHIPKLAGWYEHNGRLVDATLGLAQEYLAGGRDGWELALEGFAADGGEAFLGELEQLGAVTGELHAALAGDASDPTFAPEEPSTESLGLLLATVDEEIERIFLDLPDTDATAPLRGRGEEVRERLRALSRIGAGGRVVRTHGDFHLGQTLRLDGGWAILDFEGEPARTLPERRRKRSPLRDVAGMMRSFSYAASGARLLRGVDAAPGWEGRARERFLTGYRRTVDATLLPYSQDAIDQLLSVFELEKAVYELRYELNHRPEWVPIPVAGILRLLEAEGERR